MKHQNVRETLIDRAITVVAEEGLDKTTTKAIVSGTGINEAYIYRCFSDKEDLLEKMFDKLDDELVTVVMQHMAVMYMTEIDFELRCRLFFEAVWKFLLGNGEKCLAFIRYFYSPYFKNRSAESHHDRFRKVEDKFATVFIDEADVWMILNHILNIIYNKTNIKY